MIKQGKKLLTIISAVIIVGFCTSASIADENKVLPLKIENNLTEKKINNSVPDSYDTYDTEISGVKLKGGVKIDDKQQLVTLKLVESDLRQVLRMLADKAGKNIVMDDSVPGGVDSSGSSSGTISLDLVDVTVNKAFEYIMTIKELTYQEDGNTLIIASSERAAELGLNVTDIQPIKVRYADAQRVADFLNSNIFNLNKPEISSSSIVTSNPATNEVYIFGNKNDYNLAKKVISRLDVKPELKTFLVNFANTEILANKICTTVFQNDDSSSSSSSSSSSEDGPETSASELATVCTGNSSSSGGSGSSSFAAFESPSYMVMQDPGLSQITIYGGTTEQLLLAEAMIKSSDKKEPQVYLEISIIELSEDGSKTFNNSLTMTNSIGEQITSAAGTTGFDYPFNFNKTSYNFSDYRRIGGTISAIITSGKGRILANPRMIAANNVESTIKISEQVKVAPIITTDLVTGTQTETPGSPREVGLEFKITPKISPNGYITLNITDGTITGDKGDDGYGGRLTKERTFNSENVRVKDGETLVIAGLIQETENNNQYKTPLLADIPIIGALFKNQNTVSNRSELIFMVTPRIIKGDDLEAI